MNPKTLLLVFALLAAPAVGPAQETAAPAHPHILGIAHVAFYVHDMEKARAFYKTYLGFDEPFSVKNSDGSLRLTWIKINDAQSIELFPEKAPRTDRLIHVALQTDDPEGLRRLLKSRGVAVPDQLSHGRSGTSEFSIKDPDGHMIQFVQYLPGGWIVQDEGKHLPDTRISQHMPHAGIMVHNLDASLKFYRDILGFHEIWRGSKDKKVLNWVHMQVPDGKDFLELMLYDTPPTLARMGSMHHVCLEVADAAKAADILKARDLPAGEKPSTEVTIQIGVVGKRLINYFDPDGTRIEVMEPRTVTGKPSPSSTAPPPD